MTPPRPRRSSVARKPSTRRKPPVSSQMLVSRAERTAIDVGLESIYGAEGSIGLDLQSVRRPSRRWLAWVCLFFGLLLITVALIYLIHRETVLFWLTNMRSCGDRVWDSVRQFYQ